jgi:hypothetical protein
LGVGASTGAAAAAVRVDANGAVGKDGPVTRFVLVGVALRCWERAAWPNLRGTKVRDEAMTRSRVLSARESGGYALLILAVGYFDQGLSSGRDQKTKKPCSTVQNRACVYQITSIAYAEARLIHRNRHAAPQPFYRNSEFVRFAPEPHAL